MPLPDIESPSGRRAYAFAAIMGGCVIFTLFAAVAVYLTRDEPKLAFQLGLAAHAQILVGMTALAAQFVKRTIKAGKDGIEISDSATVTAEAKIEVKDA